MTSLDKTKIIKMVLIAVLSLLALVSIVQGCRNAMEYSQDFQWDAAKVLRLGMNPYDESIAPSNELKALGYEEYYKQMEANQFPSLLFILFPYTYLAPLAARYAWMVSNLIFTLVIVLLLRKTFLRDISAIDYLLLALLMLAGTPWRNQMGVGQHTLFSFMFFLLSVYLSEECTKRHFILSGLALCISYFKYTLTVPLALYFLYKRKWKELIISVVPHIFLTAVFAAYLNDSFLNMIIKPLKVASVLSSEGSMDIGSMLGGGIFTMILTVIMLLVLMGIVFMASSGNNDKIVISVLLLWSLIITYHRSYDYFVMILPYGWILDDSFNIAGDNEKSGGMGLILKICYTLLILLVFFGLRVFHESDISLKVVAFVYYVFTLFATALVIKRADWRKRNV